MRSIAPALCALAFVPFFLQACSKGSGNPPATAPSQAAAPVASVSASTATPAPKSAEPKPAEAKPALALPAVDRSTPEKALQSYWAAQDSLIAANARPCEDCRTLREHRRGMLTGDMLEGSRFFSEAVPAFERTIKESKKKSPAKSEKSGQEAMEIVAIIRNVTPIPDGATPEAYVKKKRESGDKYRYVLVNTEEGWKISEMFLWYDPTRNWLKISSPKPQVPFQTFS